MSVSLYKKRKAINILILYELIQVFSRYIIALSFKASAAHENTQYDDGMDYITIYFSIERSKPLLSVYLSFFRQLSFLYSVKLTGNLFSVEYQQHNVIIMYIIFWLIACKNGRHVSNKVNDYPPPTFKKKMFLYDEQRERNREMADMQHDIIQPLGHPLYNHLYPFIITYVM